jgi:quinol monooxygenase YgiN|tara:strand:- start:189 stop:662 length:474 start_codon:yes stop_codon:yes gene_type:complete
MNRLINTTFISLLLFSCVKVENSEDLNNDNIKRNSELNNIAFIINLKVNDNTSEDLDGFIGEITENVIKNESFCIEYAYYVSEDRKTVTLHEKYIDSKSGVIHGQNFMSGPFFDRFFNLFTIEEFIVVGPASDEFKKFTKDNGFVIDYRTSSDGFIR